MEESEEDKIDFDDFEFSDLESGISDIERDSDNYRDKGFVGIYNDEDYNVN